MAADAREVCVSVDGGRGQVVLWYGATLQGFVIRYQSGYSRGVALVAAVRPEGRTGSFSKLTREMRSMRRNAPPLCGQCAKSDPVVSGLDLTDTSNGPHW